MINDITNQNPVVSALVASGVVPRPIDGIGYGFEYDGLYGICTDPDNLGGILSIVFPMIFKADTLGEKLSVNVVANEVSSLVSGVKIMIVEDDVSAVYEHFLTESTDINDVIHHMLDSLKESVLLFHNSMRSFSQKDEHCVTR